METALVVGDVWRIGHQILAAELFGDLPIDLFEVVFFLCLEITASGAGGDLFHDLLAVDAGLAGASTASSSASAAGIASTPTGVATASARITPAAHAAATTAGKTIVVVLLLAFEVDGVDGYVGAVGCIDSIVERFLAAAVDAVRKDNQGLAAVLRLHQLVRGEIDGVVEFGAATVARLASAVVAGGFGALAGVAG